MSQSPVHNAVLNAFIEKYSTIHIGSLQTLIFVLFLISQLYSFLLFHLSQFLNKYCEGDIFLSQNVILSAC